MDDLCPTKNTFRKAESIKDVREHIFIQPVYECRTTRVNINNRIFHSFMKLRTDDRIEVDYPLSSLGIFFTQPANRRDYNVKSVTAKNCERFHTT